VFYHLKGSVFNLIAPTKTDTIGWLAHASELGDDFDDVKVKDLVPSETIDWSRRRRRAIHQRTQKTKHHAS
jgi:hypothetical protein